MVQPIETTILQGIRNVLFHSGCEIFNVCIRKPGIFEIADVEMKSCSHHLEASDPQLHVRASEVHLIVAAIADKEIVNRQMLDTNPSIGSIKEMLDIDFGSACDDDLKPRSLCGCICQDPQETWATFSIATLVKCVNEKDESALREVRKGADKIKEEGTFHRLRSKVWVVAKVLCYNCLKRWEDDGEFVDESRKDVYGLAQIWVVSPAEKSCSKVVSLVKACADRMS